MDTKFDISTDFEFYCYLKAHLPDEYEVLSEPRKSYYSEWDFDYKIYHHGQLLKEYAGDFREIEPGYLMKEAKQLLADIGGQSVNR
jgi:hypothetical protein